MIDSYNTTLNKFFSIAVAVRLPGSVSSNAPTAAGNGAIWHPQLGEKAQLSASAFFIAYGVMSLPGAVLSNPGGRRSTSPGP